MEGWNRAVFENSGSHHIIRKWNQINGSWSAFLNECVNFYTSSHSCLLQKYTSIGKSKEKKTKQTPETVS